MVAKMVALLAGGNRLNGSANWLSKAASQNYDSEFWEDSIKAKIKSKKQYIELNEVTVLPSIITFSNNICGQIQHSGYSYVTQTETDAKIKLELKKLINILTSAGIKVSNDTEEYSLALQKDLEVVLVNDTNCRLNVANKLIEKLISNN